VSRVIAFLARPDARPTYIYEQRVVGAVELVAFVGMLAASPTMPTSASGLLGLAGAMLAQTARSVAARRRERAEQLGLPPLRVACEEADELRAKLQQYLAAASPIVGVLAAWGSAGITRAVVVGAICAAIRQAYIEGYGQWRCWYRARRPMGIA